MADRRRHQRFVLGDGAEGTFRALEDVAVEQVSENELLITTVAPVRVGETVTVEIQAEAGERETILTGEVTECRPTTTEGTLRHRVVVQVKERQERKNQGHADS